MTRHAHPAIRLLQVAVASMNATHAEELHIIEQLLAALHGEDADAAMQAAAHFAAHVKEHFAREEQLMEQYGFPPRPIHKAEHERMRPLVAEACAAADTPQGRRQLLQFIEQQFLPWLEHHVATMDTATAHFLAMHGVE